MNTNRDFSILAVVVCILVWIYLLVGAIRLEERGTHPREYRIDNNGEVVQVHERVWELGRGYRAATQEEKDFEGRR